MRFSYEFENTAGKHCNSRYTVSGSWIVTADTLSRAPGSVPAQQDHQMEVETNMFISFLVESLPVTDQLREKTCRSQLKHKVCSQVINFCKTGAWPQTARRDTFETILVCP